MKTIYPNKQKQSYFIKPNYKINTLYKRITISEIWQETKGLIKRLSLQLYRKPINMIVNIVQPLLWLILFGALFENVPITLFGPYYIKYPVFLSSGIIIFTSFTASTNAGLPIIFDREFGFFNRILISPIRYKNSLLISLITYTWLTSIFQVLTITIFSIYLLKNIIIINHIITMIVTSTLISIQITSLSICLGFILPGHIEFLAFTLLINLPTLFSSTALAPLSFMPYWLQIITCLNPLTYAIEIIRQISINNNIKYTTNIIETNFFKINIFETIIILGIINLFNLIIVKKILKYKYN